MSQRRVCLVGAGYIAHVHAEALNQIPGVTITAVVDAQQSAAEAFARRWRIPSSHASVADLLAAERPDCAHVLVPPDQHLAAARPLVAAGVPVLVEKPLGVSAADCQALLSAAAAAGTTVGVNQNFVHHPAFRRLMARIDRGDVGRLRAVSMIFNVPLRQMAARQFGHWMFHQPCNLLLEQAVHPLSQLFALAGPAEDMAVLADPPVEIAAGVPFHPIASIALACRKPGGRRVQAQMRFAVGQDYPFWQITAVCDDGVIVADMYADRCYGFGRSRWPDFVDAPVAGVGAAGRVAADSLRYGADYLLSLTRLKRRADPFFQSMRASIAEFHRALDEGRRPYSDGAFGMALVECCETIAARAFAAPGPQPTPRPQAGYDVAVLGGTGFIGRHVVTRLLAEGLRVGVMARNTRNLPAVFAAPGVSLIRGDIRRREDVEHAIGAARLVINLAHGGGGASFDEIRESLVGSARLVAESCLRKGVTRLVHVSSIAALYLGDANETVTGATPPDAKAERRGDYARAKALAEVMLLDMHHDDHLPVCILRPGVVVGEGGIAFHGGLGFFNNEQHCIGWNGGRNPLPFVLAEDVADAVARALTADRAVGNCYNLVGDVRLDAGHYIAELGRALGRPLRFHPQNVHALWLAELGKWLVKRAVGRRAPAPTLRDLRSRGMVARFDTDDAKRDLGWQPAADRPSFVRAAIEVHAEQSPARVAAPVESRQAPVFAIAGERRS